METCIIACWDFIHDPENINTQPPDFLPECSYCQGTGTVNVTIWNGGIRIDGERPCDCMEGEE